MPVKSSHGTELPVIYPGWQEMASLGEGLPRLMSGGSVDGTNVSVSKSAPSSDDTGWHLTRYEMGSARSLMSRHATHDLQLRYWHKAKTCKGIWSCSQLCSEPRTTASHGVDDEDVSASVKLPAFPLCGFLDNNKYHNGSVYKSVFFFIFSHHASVTPLILSLSLLPLLVQRTLLFSPIRMFLTISRR